MYKGCEVYLFIKWHHHVWEAGKIKKQKEDELTWQVLPEGIRGAAKLKWPISLLRTFHGNDH